MEMSKRQMILSVFLIALCMSFFVSLVMTFINVGMKDIFFKAWMSGWAIGLIVVLPVSFIFPPAINKLVMKIVK